MKRNILLAAAIVVWSVAPNSVWASGYTATRYPVVLAHGMGGFDEIFGIVEYWNGIPDALRAGGADVYVTSVSGYHSTEVRGEQLLTQVEEIVAITGEPKVHLIGHSQGGLDVRYVAAVRPDLVASVTTIGGPHRGAALANYLRDHLEEGGGTEKVLSTIANKLGALSAFLTGRSQPQDALATLYSLTSEGVAEFNARYPQGLPETACADGPAVVDGVHYFSWSGTGAVTNALDISDGLMWLTSQIYGEDNDGLVGRCSSHLGRVIRDDYDQNHFDEVNQLFGLVHLFSSNPASIYRAHLNRLCNLGM